MNKNELSKANQLKAVFNVAWDAATRNNNGALSYRDMTRISDGVKYECPRILGVHEVPKDILNGLEMACAVVDPNKARLKESIKTLFGLGGGAGGVSILTWGVITLIHPGVWASFIAIFAGGVAGGPIALVAVPAGIAFLVGSLYMTLQKMTPQERATKAHKFVMEGIDRWHAGVK